MEKKKKLKKLLKILNIYLFFTLELKTKNMEYIFYPKGSVSMPNVFHSVFDYYLKYVSEYTKDCSAILCSYRDWLKDVIISDFYFI